MRNLLIKICYKGTNYHGYQVQKNAITIASVFQGAVQRILQKREDIVGCSRTDSGVHANEYFLTMKTDSNIKNDKLMLGLNTYLPKDISVLEISDTTNDFHPRYCAKKKQYIYKIVNSHSHNPFLTDLAYQYRPKIDEILLNEAANGFIGKHDFKAFCSTSVDISDTIREIYDFDVIRNGDIVEFRVTGNGFLYNMVRIMVGTLLFVNEKKIEKSQICDIIVSKNRKLAGKTAPALGLYLNKVYY